MIRSNRFVLTLPCLAIALWLAGAPAPAAAQPAGLATGSRPTDPPTAPGGLAGVPGPSRPGAGAPGGLAGQALFQCAPTYTMLNQHMAGPGTKSAHYECESPTVVQCPDKGAVRHPYGGAPAAGMGIEVKAVPVGQVGDYNRYKIQYKCTYFWNNG